MSAPNFGIPGVGTLLQGPPFDPSTLKAPLTAAQRAAIVAWAAAVSAEHGGTVNAAQLNADTDQQLITDYTTAYTFNNAVTSLNNAPITGPSVSGLQLPDFLSQLSNPKLWTRVAEFTVGGIMIAIALNALAKNTTGVNPAGAARKVTKLSPIGAVAGAAKSSRGKVDLSTPVL